MTAPETLTFDCPFCTAPVVAMVGDAAAGCPACEQTTPLMGHVCPNCRTAVAEDQVVCPTCTAALSRVCPRCGTRNWSGHESCAGCGDHLGVDDIIRRHDPAATAKRLARQSAEAAGFKAIETAGHNRRMADLLVREEARLQELRRRQAYLQRQARRRLFMVAGLGALFLISLILFALLAA